jgi:protein gp37
MNGTKISWTDASWNPVLGCSRVSEGCRNCYAERIALKFHHSRLPWSAANAAENVQLKPHKLGEPLKLKKPSVIFVNSMSDLYHERVPDEYLARVFGVMNRTPQHTYQLLTKRPERAAEWAGPWTPNIWQGTSVEDERVIDRIDALRQCGAAIKFLSVEPLLGPMPDLDLTGIDWVIVGGESGPGYRPMDHAWAREIRDACVAQGAAFFFKQSAAFTTERGTALLEADGSAWEWHQFPGKLEPPRLVRPAA